MYLLNLKGTVSAFMNASAVDENYIELDEGVDREKFMLFLRIMKAENPSDIEDISTEDLISLYSDAADFSLYFGEKPDYIHKYKGEVGTKKSVRLGRRVL